METHPSPTLEELGLESESMLPSSSNSRGVESKPSDTPIFITFSPSQLRLARLKEEVWTQSLHWQVLWLRGTGIFANIVIITIGFFALPNFARFWSVQTAFLAIQLMLLLACANCLLVFASMLRLSIGLRCEITEIHRKLEQFLNDRAKPPSTIDRQ